MAAFVTFEDVSKVYHSGEIEIRAVDHISFTIEKGEFCVIVGPSGAGKTTVLNMLGGMDACSGGTITVDGTLVSGFNARQLTTYRRHDIGFVFQFYNLVGNLTALENVELPLLYRGSPAKERHEAARAALDRVGLLRWERHTPAELSGGQQQRVAIARAIVTHPLLLLADEPTGSLDSKRSIEIMELLTDLNKTEGITVVLVTHEPDMASYASRCIRCVDGRIASDTRTGGRDAR